MSSETKYKQVLELDKDLLAQFPEENPNPVMLVDPEGRILYCNPAGQRLCRKYQLTELNLQTHESQRFTASIFESLSPVFKETGEVELELGDTFYRIFSSKTLHENVMFLFWQDISQQKRYEALLYLTESVIERTVEGIFITNSLGVIERVNPAFSYITGYSAAEAIGATPRILKSDHQGNEFYEEMWARILENGFWEGEIWNRKKNGLAIPVWQSISIIAQASQKEKKYISIFHDISDIKHTEAQLEHQAYHDILTGLPNRQLFLDRLQQAIASAKRNKQKTAVILLDIDNFKKINDSLGHHLGDQYLQIIAQRLKESCREEDTIARLGGDEFAMITLYLDDQKDVLDILERIQKSISLPVSLKNHDIAPSASIGVTFYPEDGDNAHALLQNADLAMYKAKLSEKGGYALFNLSLHQQARKRIQLETEIRQALDSQQFTLYYQPKIETASGRVCRVEALVRWEREGKVISPADFIPVAEESGLIFPLGRQILIQACNEICDLHHRGFPEISVAINISGKQFQDASLQNQIQDVIHETGINPEKVNIEITENIAISDIESALHMIDELADMGVKTSIDDFGTGYSSLSYIKRFNSHVLKIDKSFIDDIPIEQADQAIVQAIVSMSHAVGMEVVAEGVETKAQVEYLKAVGCDYIQGYYYSKPFPITELITRIDSNYLLLN